MPILAGLGLLVLLGVGALAWHVQQLDAEVRREFEGKRWSLPAHVYARPLELYAGMTLKPEQLAAELAGLNYRSGDAAQPGGFVRQGNRFAIHTRAFTFWDGAQPAQLAEVRLADGRVAALSGAADAPLGLLRLEPLRIGGIYAAHQEDRILVRLPEVPKFLIDALLAVEDRNFLFHRGVSPRAIARAAWANLRAGHTVQGGSTLTQQLVKNYFLSNARTLQRKFNEAIMALILEWRYSKEEILEAYLNEVYLAQDGARAVHGFGLASQFYFERPLAELKPAQLALLVGLVKGPSYYDPRRNPQRALARRNLVLEQAATAGVLSAAALAKVRAEPLAVVPRAPSGISPYPGFFDLVRRQLKRDYAEEDLNSEGLKIFTTLDPYVQQATERVLAERLTQLERSRKQPAGTLQGAVVVTHPQNGEVLALVGGRQPKQAGFNRALDAVRPIGSLVKPAIYLTALAQPERYTLASLLEDIPVSLRNVDGSYWTPQNYDREFHGIVSLEAALAESLNLATVRLGLELGIPAVIDMLNRLGLDVPIDPYPSLFLGAIGAAPIQVAQMYQTIAAGGFRTPLKAIREVLTQRNEALQRYPLQVSQAADPGPVYLLTHALQDAARNGTGRSMYQVLDEKLDLAGKTGTTDELRDSWYAGFSSDLLAVVWVGRDDNKPAGFSGAAGALQVWTQLLAALPVQPLQAVPPGNVEMAWIDPLTHTRRDGPCEGAERLPVLATAAAGDYLPCDGSLGAEQETWLSRSLKWLQGDTP